MSTLIISFVVLLFVIIGMSIGVLMGRSPLKGSCGGVGAALNDPDYVCDLCGNDPAKCEEEQRKDTKNITNKTELGYEVASRHKN